MSGETVSFFLIGAALVFTLRPLFFGWERWAFSPTDLAQRRRILEDQRDTLFSNLKDLEMEWRMGRLDGEDYKDLKLGYEKEAGEILRELDRLAPVESEARVSTEEDGGRSIRNYCSRCGAQVLSTDRFCPQCGVRIPE